MELESTPFPCHVDFTMIQLGFAKAIRQQLMQSIQTASDADIYAIAAHLEGMPNGRAVAAPQTNGAAVKAVAAPKAAPAGKSAPKGKGGRRTRAKVAEDAEKNLKAIVNYLGTKSLGAEIIREGINVEKALLDEAIKKGLADGILSKSGVKRSTVYTVGGTKKAAGPGSGGKKKAAKKSPKG